MARNKLNKDKLKEKLNKYQRPKDGKNLVGAKANPEKWSNVK